MECDDEREERLARRREAYAAQSDDQREERLVRREAYATQSNHHQREERLPRTQQIHDSRLIKFHNTVSSVTHAWKDFLICQSHAIKECIRCGSDKHQGQI